MFEFVRHPFPLTIVPSLCRSKMTVSYSVEGGQKFRRIYMNLDLPQYFCVVFFRNLDTDQDSRQREMLYGVILQVFGKFRSVIREVHFAERFKRKHTASLHTVSCCTRCEEKRIEPFTVLVNEMFQFAGIIQNAGKGAGIGIMVG